MADDRKTQVLHGYDVGSSYSQDLNLGQLVAEARQAASSTVGYRTSLQRAAEVHTRPAGTSALEKFSDTFSAKTRG